MLEKKKKLSSIFIPLMPFNSSLHFRLESPCIFRVSYNTTCIVSFNFCHHGYVAVLTNCRWIIWFRIYIYNCHVGDLCTRVWMDVTTCAVKRDEMVESFTGVQGFYRFSNASPTHVTQHSPFLEGCRWFFVTSDIVSRLYTTDNSSFFPLILIMVSTFLPIFFSLKFFPYTIIISIWKIIGY